MESHQRGPCQVVCLVSYCAIMPDFILFATMAACALTQSVDTAVTSHRLGNDQCTRPSVWKQKSRFRTKQPHHGQKGQQQGGKLWPDMSPNNNTRNWKTLFLVKLFLCLYVEPLTTIVYTVDTGIYHVNASVFKIRTQLSNGTKRYSKVFSSTSPLN